MAVGKRIGLSFEEINDLRVCDLLAMASSYTGQDDDEEIEAKDATQTDIDAFFSR